VKALKQRQKELQNVSPFDVAKMRELSVGKENMINHGRNGQAGTPSPPNVPPGPTPCLPVSHPSMNCPSSGNPLLIGPNIHQMQQLIQQQLISPSQLQQLMQQQTLLFQQQVSPCKDTCSFPACIFILLVGSNRFEEKAVLPLISVYIVPSNTINSLKLVVSN